MTPTQISDLLSDEKLNEYRKKIPQGVSHEQLKIEAYNAVEGNMKYTDCLKCKNKGYIAVLDTDGDMAVRECDCMRVRRLFGNLEHSGLQGAYEKYKLDTFKADKEWQEDMLTKAQSYVQDVVSGKKLWLYVGGQRGAGKSHICCAVSGKLIAHGKVALYKMWRDVVSEYRSKLYREDERTEMMYKLIGCDLLYIDDFLKCRDKREIDKHYDIAFEILNARYNARRPTVISSELTISELSREDSSLSGRICEMSDNGKYVISIAHDPEKDMRLKNID